MVVFVPGFMQHGEAWAEVAARVGERYPSVCLEHSTHTASGRIEEIGRAVGPDDVLVGYSLGGRLALHAAIAGVRPKSLVLVSCNAGIEDSRARAERRESDRVLADWMAGATIEEIVERWQRQPVFATQSPALVDGQRYGRLRHEPADLARLLRSAGQGEMEPVWDRLPELEMPVLTLAGALDERYAEAAERMASLLPEGRAVFIDGAGHAPQLERPAQTAEAILSFLDSVGNR